MRSYFHKMVPWPSGKARVCKTLIPQFKSGRYLQKSTFFVRRMSIFTSSLFTIFRVDFGEVISYNE